MSECIQWWGSVGSNGYGHFGLRNRGGRQAHRRIYEECFGLIPDGMIVHHECVNRLCINPEHLVLTTFADHPDSGPGVNRAMTHCHEGHEFTPENTHVEGDGGRRCRECRKIRMRALRATNRQSHAFSCLDCGDAVSRRGYRCPHCAAVERETSRRVRRDARARAAR